MSANPDAIRGGCTPRMARCKATCGHYLWVTDFVQERQRWEQQRDDAANGYPTEEQEFQRDNPGPTLKQWMIARRW